MPLIDLYSGSSGLNTALDPQRLSQGGANTPGIIEFSQAVNVSIDERGLVTLRNGDTLANPGEFHSLFCDGGDCFIIQERTNDAALMRVAADLSLSGIRSGLTKGQRMSFAQANYDTFYSNGIENGYIRGGVSAAWPVETYYGPDTNTSFGPAPVGDLIAFRPGGGMLIASGPVLHFNRFPFNFGLYAGTDIVQFGSDITMIAPVAAGTFVSDGERTWFLQGESWFDTTQKLAAEYPALTGSLAHNKVTLRDMGLDSSGFGRIWASTEGVCLGLDDGSFINLTDDKIDYPAGHSTGACVTTKSHIIHTVE